jgi:hypothetical protein
MAPIGRLVLRVPRKGRWFHQSLLIFTCTTFSTYGVINGDMIIIRYADDSVLGFEYEQDARRFLQDMQGRLQSFGLRLHPDKIRLIRF